MKKEYITKLFRTKYLFVHVLLIGFISTNAQTWYETAEERIDTLRKGNFTLRITDELSNPLTDSVYIHLKKHEFPWGNTVEHFDNTTMSKWKQCALLKYYNAGVVESFKWPYMESTEGVVNYSDVDAVYAWADSVDWDVRAHTLIWGGDENWQMPGWTLTMTGEELYNACETRVRREVNRYKGIIKEYDVINEPIHETWLYSNAGDSIKWNSYIWANEENPEARLFVNEYNVIVWGPTDTFVDTVRNMMDHGAPIDGIGVQGHMEGTLNWSDIKSRLDQVATLGLPIKVTEFDMKIDEQNISEQSMANAYGMMMRICFSHPSVAGLIWWGYKDPTYRNGSGIFDEDKRPKIAADTVYHLIHEKWSTNIKGIPAGDGSISFNGFYGDYEVGVKVGDEYLVIPASCLKANEGSEIAVSLIDAVPEPPKLIRADHDLTGTIVYLYFDKSMNDPASSVTDFLLYAVAPSTISSVTLGDDASVVQLNLASNLHYGSYYSISYIPGNLTSTNGGKLYYAGPETVPNKIPGFVSVETTIDGIALEISLSASISDPSGSLDNFTVEVNGDPILLTGIEHKTGYDSIFILTLADPITSPDDLIKFSYTRGTLTNPEGYLLDNVSRMIVTNNLPSMLSDKKGSVIKIYPNPFNDALIIDARKTEGFDKIILTDISGKEIKHVLLRNTRYFTLCSSELLPGPYIVRLFKDNTLVTERSIIKE
jgi:GH35 family endo-1,4-beta-xylanase